MLGWREDGRKPLLLGVTHRETPSRVLNSLWRPVWPLLTATQEEARYFHRQIAPIRDVIDRLGRAASI